MSNLSDLIKNQQKLLNNMPEPYSIPEVRDYKLADRQYEIIMESIAQFESKLDENHEVAVKLASFGQTILLNVTAVGYRNPSILYFHGFVNEEPATLVQHVSQLNFLLLSVRKDDSTRPLRRIGFSITHNENKDEKTITD